MSAIPEAVKDGIQFWPIPDIEKVTAAFGAGNEMFFPRRNLPDVPRKFTDAAETLFFSGGKLPEFASGVDRAKAATMLRALLGSFAPAHEAKISTAGYAMWVWSTPQALTKATK